MVLILSLQGCMAVGKTTAARWLETHVSNIYVSYVIAVGIAPGPGVGQILKELLNKVLDESVQNEREILLKLISIE